ncbi:PREDICTED: transmembrane protein 117-like [Cariama cristata]|uniref:transmembrane protein 117-like n=1 Tax=Cariama cristata TaxID=54380 RepID=UPI000520644E|nr:PREDICTED: transmembrane protein 117-like [Cariama cristata]
MVPIANSADLNYSSKLPVCQEARVPRKEDGENQCAQQTSTEGLLEILSYSENIYLHVRFGYEGGIGGKNHCCGSRDGMRGRNATQPRLMYRKKHVTAYQSVLLVTVLFTLTSVVVLVITTDWISWDKLNRGFLPSDEVSRAFLASFILVFDLLIVMQDWEFPHFMGDVEVNLPGLPSAHMQLKVPYFQKIFKEEYHIHITGKWFNYGIIFLVLILDLNMWKNQIFYKPHEYGQYIGPGQKIYTVKDSESLKDLNRTKLSWEWRSNNTNPLTNRTYAEGDMFLHSRFTGSSLDVKCLAFIPSLLAFALFGFFIWFFGRFQKTDQGMENLDKSYTRMKRKSPSDMGMTRENTQVLVEEPLSFQEPHLVSIKSDLSEIVFNSSLLTSENLNAQLSEQDSPLQPVPEASVPKSTPVT